MSRRKDIVGPTNADRDALDRLVAGIVDGLSFASDEELRDEVREIYGDDDKFVAGVSATIERALRQAGLKTPRPG
jgi:hypothetical protein